jgi:hypothetical protein
MAKINQKIDKLTNSIVNRVSGDSFDTEVIQIEKTEIKTLNKRWKFDWHKELKVGMVYKLVIRYYPDIIQGLMSLIDKKDHLYMNLVEAAPHNFGTNKIYEGVLGNLVAFACKLSFDKGYEGYVAFEPKTKLIEHYKKTIKAQLISSNRMIINSDSAIFLINKYFNK